MLPLAFAGCAGTNPGAAFGDVNRTVAARTGESLVWLPDGATNQAAAQITTRLLQTNLTAQSAVTIALLNNCSLQAEFEEIGISQAELAQAARLQNPVIFGDWRFPNQPPSLADIQYTAAGNFLDLLTQPARKAIAARNLEQTKLETAVIGMNTEGLSKAINKLVPGYMAMGQNGMGDMGEMGMPVPTNSLPMVGGQGQFDYITMGGMFTLLKVRDEIPPNNTDPGWYQNPPGTVSDVAPDSDLIRDGITT